MRERGRQGGTENDRVGEREKERGRGEERKRCVYQSTNVERD